MSTSSDPNPYASPRSDLPPVISPPNVGQFVGPQFAPCPKCGCTYATKVSFTWWGGLVGPALLSHVTCQQCRTAYNGKSGKSNDTAIMVYFLVTFVLALAIGGATIFLG
ncbi:MAG TPA: hypothetical protein VL096_04195 [Pirellulaceae bacterium]|nr:hypothetical protein [Pirellulaceae bacterium]